MKTRYALWFLFFALVGNQAIAQAYDELDINDMRARFYAHGLIGQNLSTSQAAFEVPVNGGAHPLYSAGMWVAGTTTDGQLRVAAMKYEASGEGDYYTGPLTIDGSASTSADVMTQYDQVWSVTGAEVAAHTSYFQCLADVNCDVAVEFPNGYTIPSSILNWPAINGNPGYATYFAPFYDFNGDGDYTPAAGDAPCILGDQALYYVFNDKGGPHLLSGSQPIGLEIQAMPFAYSSGDPYLDQTVFVHYHIINRGTETLENTRLGLFNDFDLGCGDDDYVGTHVGRNLTYVYNADEDDQDCAASTGYGGQPPAFGMVLLKGPYVDYNSVDDPQANVLPAYNGLLFGDAVVDNEQFGATKNMHMYRQGDACCNDASSTLHYWNYLNGFWKDGTPLTHGGNGYAPTDPNAVPAAFCFPGGSDPFGVGTNGQVLPAWSEGLLTEPDRRTVTSAGPFTLEPGQHNDLLFAYVYARGASGGASASVAALLARVDSVRAFAYTLPLWTTFRDDFQGSCEGITTTTIAEAQSIGQLQLFPVPAFDKVQLNATKEIAGELLTLHDATARIIAAHRLVQGLNEININSLAPGIYSCEVRSAYAHFTGRLVKE